jgi:nucleotide-binding universal stress UspA family protein
MTKFSKILYVISQPEDVNPNTASLAMRLASEHHAELSAWTLLPAVPQQAGAHSKDLETSYKQKVSESLLAAGKALGSDVSYAVHCEPSSRTPLPVVIIQKVLREGYDLVVKTVDPLQGASSRGFSSLDMNLLRKCPCPLWLGRPEFKKFSKIVVAIDPNEQEGAGRNLGLRLLRIAETLVERDAANVSILSCWKLEYENFLRCSPFGRLPEAEVDALAEQAKIAHSLALDRMIRDSGIKRTLPIQLRKGDPGEQVPGFVDEHGIELIIMGTVARTGIPGFIIGNTAESVVQNLRCSILAVKPEGFVSPVTI